MVKVRYINKELETLFTKSNSPTFQSLESKTVFLKSLFAFKELLLFIDNVMDLRIYQWLHLRRGSDYSSVTIEGSGLKGDVLFKEAENGSSIILYDLIIQ